MALVVVMAFAHVVHSDDHAGSARWSGVAMTAASVGLYVTYTRAAWLAAILGVARRRRRQGPPVRRLSRAVAVLDRAAHRARASPPGSPTSSEESTARGEPSNSLTWRAEYWAEALDLAHESPITGIGLKQVAAQSEEGKQPHNDFLRAYVEMGVVGLRRLLLADLAVPQHRPTRGAGDPRTGRRATSALRGRLRRLRRGLRAHVLRREPDVAGRGRPVLRGVRRRRRRDRVGARRLARPERPARTSDDRRIGGGGADAHPPREQVPAPQGRRRGLHARPRRAAARSTGTTVGFFGMDHPEQRPGQRRRAGVVRRVRPAARRVRRRRSRSRPG